MFDFSHSDHEDCSGDDYARCPYHGEIISNGMFDAPCGQCEGEADEYSDWMQANEERPISCDAPFRSEYVVKRCTPWAPSGPCLTANPSPDEEDSILF